MTDSALPTDIQDLISKHIDSIAHLEALLLLWRNPEVSWDFASLSKRLYINEKDARAILERLLTRGFAVESGGIFRYQSSLDVADVMVNRLSSFYATHLILITNLIHAKPSRRIQQFADAFNLRKDK